MAWMLADALGIDRRQSPGETRIYRVVVRDLVLPCRVGVHAYEKTAPQRLRINVEVLAERAGSGDQLHQVLNYESIVEGIRALTHGEHINLIETLADRIMDLALASALALAARVSVEKLDVFPEAESVGVVLRRRRPRGFRAG
jgi:dihydroneopterin aldolase